MNAAVRAVVRMGIYVGCRVFLIHEVICVFVSYFTDCFNVPELNVK